MLHLTSESGSAWQRAICLCLMLPLCAGCEPPGKPNRADMPRMPDQILGFETLFAQNCAGCHGTEGNHGPAPPLNDPLFVSMVSTTELATIIQNGRQGTPMPPFGKVQGGPLTEQQIEVLAAGIRSHWTTYTPTPIQPPAYALNPKAIDASPKTLERGKAVFQRACAECHGTEGRGVADGDEIKNAINHPAFLSLISNQALRRVIITGRPDLGMPGFSEPTGRSADFQPLTSKEIDDVVSLLASWRTTKATR